MWVYASVPTEALRSRARVCVGPPNLVDSVRRTGIAAARSRTAPLARGPRPDTQDQRHTTNRGDLISTKEATIELEGEVTEALRNGMFRIKLDNGHETIGYVAGKMRRYRIRIMLGDRIKIELSPYDLNRGRIVYRYK
jgi:translation initiation factor IF-1